jgi:hypothetical protein
MELIMNDVAETGFAKVPTEGLLTQALPAQYFLTAVPFPPREDPRRQEGISIAVFLPNLSRRLRSLIL